MTRTKKRWLVLGGTAAAIEIAHLVLLYVVADKRVVAVILAAGEHTPPGTLVLVGLFFLFRMLAILVVPALVAAALARQALAHWLDRRAKSPQSTIDHDDGAAPSV